MKPPTAWSNRLNHLNSTCRCCCCCFWYRWHWCVLVKRRHNNTALQTAPALEKQSGSWLICKLNQLWTGTSTSLSTGTTLRLMAKREWGTSKIPAKPRLILPGMANTFISLFFSGSTLLFLKEKKTSHTKLLRFHAGNTLVASVADFQMTAFVSPAVVCANLWLGKEIVSYSRTDNIL